MWFFTRICLDGTPETSILPDLSLRKKEWKERINRRIAKERTTTGSEKECPPKADAWFWLDVVAKKENAWPPKLATTNKLPRVLTLKSRSDIDRLLKSGERKTGSYATAAWELSDSFHYAVLVSGKIKQAVARNRLKRLFREAIRLNRKALPQPVNIAFIVRRPTNEPRFNDINKEVLGTFEYISSQLG